MASLCSYTEKLWTHTFQHLHYPHETTSNSRKPRQTTDSRKRSWYAHGSTTMLEWEGLIDNIHKLVRLALQTQLQVALPTSVE